MTAIPKVSVLLASYNHAPFVEQAVRSVLDQDYRDLEIVAVDDASTDSTAEIIAGISDPRLTLHRLERNRETHSRCRAATLARGAYVAVVNSDDVWLPGKLAQQVAILDEHPEVAAVFTGVRLIDDNGRQRSGRSPFRLEHHDSAGWLRRFFLHGNCLCHASVLMRRDLMEAVGGYDPSLLLLGDLDLWVRLAAVGGLHVIDAPLTANRVLGGARNISAQSPANSARHLFEVQGVLWRYTEPPILSQLATVFPDRPAFAAATDDASRRWALARMALNGPRREHRLFALTLMQAILRQPDAVTRLPSEDGPEPLAAYAKAVAETRLFVSWSRGRSLIDGELQAFSQVGRSALRALANMVSRSLRR